MILSQLRDYLRLRGQATLADIALHFDADPEVVRAMLEVWMRKGKIERGPVSIACGSGCDRCEPEATELYRWAESTEVSGAELRVEKGCPR